MGGRGQFTVLADGKRIFDKDEAGTFPDELEVVADLQGL